jgi:pantetheine-phosphate adenylyltransferase
MTSPVAIYAGSFDPPTLGHIDVIERGAALFESLIVAVGHNPAKRYWFDLETRCALVKASMSRSNVRIVPFSGLLVDAVKQNGATVILRGLRVLSDFDLEFRNGLANRDMTGIETLFLLTDPRHIFVSSSLVKELASNGGDVTRYVSAPVAQAIRSKIAAG